MGAAFICKKCQKETPPSAMAVGLVVDGEKYDIDYNFCYLGDMLTTDGEANTAVTPRKKFRELAPF